MNRWTMALLVAGMALLAGCENGGDEPLNQEPLDRVSAALTATTEAKTIAQGVAGALALVQQSPLLERLANAFGGSGMVCSAALDDQGDPLPETCTEEPADLDLGLDGTDDKLVAWIEAAVFDPSQVETEDGTTLVVRLLPAVFCAAPWGDGSEGGQSPEAAAVEPLQGGLDDTAGDDVTDDGETDDPCVDFLTRVPVRLRFQEWSSVGMQVDVLFGDSLVDPFDVTLRTDGVVVRVDLAKAREAALIVSAAYAADGETIEIPQVATGTVQADLVHFDTGLWKLWLQVTDDVVIDKDMNGQHSRLEVGANTEASVSATDDGTRVMLDADVKAVALSIPYQWIVDAWFEDRDGESPTVAGNVSAALPAVEAHVTYDDAAQTVEVLGSGLPAGPVVATRDGATLLSLVLNPDAGGVLNTVLGLGDTYETTVAVTPGVDFSVEGHLAALAADMPDLPAFLQDETFRVRFDGADQPAATVVDQGVDEFLRVTAGTLAISSTAAPDQTVTVPTGSCLSVADEQGALDETSSEDAADAAHDVLSSLVSGTCP